jgi:hypothetical protein
VPCTTQPTVGEIDDPLAAFRLVHVVGGNQHGHAVRRHLVDHVPELAPRLGIHAGGWFIEQQQTRSMQYAGGQRQALLPPARQFARKLIGSVTSRAVCKASRGLNLLIMRSA